MTIRAVLAVLGLSSFINVSAGENTMPADTTLKFCEDPWPPYTYGEMGKTPTGGYAVTFLNEISKRTNLSIDMKLFPWKRCLFMAEKGNMDGVMLLTSSEERAGYLEFTRPLMSDNNLAWFKKGLQLKGSWASFEELKPYRIGVTAGFNYGDKFNKAKKRYQLKTDEANDIIANFNKLALERIDIFFVNLAAANDALKEFPELRAQVTYTDGLFEKVPFYIGFSKQSPAKKYLPDFNKAIDSMIKDGTIERILNN